MRLIYADKLQKDISVSDSMTDDYGIKTGYAICMRLIDEQPTIEERKKGKWLWEIAENGWANHICSECGWTKNTDIHVSLGYKFCPDCGSYNGGEQD